MQSAYSLFYYKGEIIMAEKEEIKVVDRHGLPSEEECSYLKIPTDERDLVVEVLLENDLPNFKEFDSASEVFSEAIAEVYIKNKEEGGMEDEEEDVKTLTSIVRREELGKSISEYIKPDSIVNDALLDIVDEEYLKIVERVEVEKEGLE
jgi:hypothetical protein